MRKTAIESQHKTPISGRRQLKDLAGVGPATIADLHLLGIHSVPELASNDGEELYQRLCSLTGVEHDICCLDVFRCAIAQACDPKLPEDQKNWWYWSKLRTKTFSTLKGEIFTSKHCKG